MLEERCAIWSSTAQDQSVREARLVPERRALRLSLQGDNRLARWSLERRLSDEAYRRVFRRPLVL